MENSLENLYVDTGAQRVKVFSAAKGAIQYVILATLISSCVKIMLFSRMKICFRAKAYLYYKCDYYMALKSIKLMLNLKYLVQRKVNKNKSACKRVDSGFDIKVSKLIALNKEENGKGIDSMNFIWRIYRY